MVTINTNIESQLGEDWKTLFYPVILERGRIYQSEGRVVNITKEGNIIRATVYGARDYEIEIRLEDGGFLEHMTCSCPFAEKSNCKHMAAVLFDIEEGAEIREINDPPRQIRTVKKVPVVLPWLEAVDTLPEQELRQILLRLADRNPELQERLVFHMLHAVPGETLNNWEADLQELAAEHANRWGILDQDEDVFIYEVEQFLANKNAMIMEARAYPSGFALCWIALKTICDQVYNYFPKEEIQIIRDFARDNWKKQWLLSDKSQRAEIIEFFDQIKEQEDCEALSSEINFVSVLLEKKI